MSSGLVAFHSIYFVSLGLYALFFTDSILASVSVNHEESILNFDIKDIIVSISKAGLKYFGAVFILAGFFLL